MSSSGSVRNPALAISTRLACPERRIRLRRLRRLPLDPRAVAPRRLIHRVATPIRLARQDPRAHRKDEAGRVARADDGVVRPRGTVDEVPLPERTLLALD